MPLVLTNANQIIQKHNKNSLKQNRQHDHIQSKNIIFQPTPFIQEALYLIDHLFELEQCPPIDFWPEPKLMAGGSRSILIGLLTFQSQIKKTERETQKIICSFLFFIKT